MDTIVNTFIEGKIITGALAFNQVHIIEPWIKNACKYSDLIIVACSDKPWSVYNKESYKVESDGTSKLLWKLKDKYPKLIVMYGEWDNETAQRNEVVRKAYELNAKVFLIVDTDEFYFPEQVKAAIQWAGDQKKFGCWFFSHYQFIKKRNWIIEASDGLPKFQGLVFSKDGLYFNQKREIVPIAGSIPEEITMCYHASYYQPREKLIEKLTCFGHATQIKPRWVEEVWDKLDENSVDFHPVQPSGWKSIKVFRDSVPGEFAELNF